MPVPPKRTENRRRRNKPEGVQVSKGTAGGAITWPAPDRTWEQLVTDLYAALQVSGQVEFFEQSDVAWARYALSMMNSTLTTDRPSAQMVASVQSMFNDLLVNEASRRRARIELERKGGVADPEEIAAVADFEAYQRKLGG